MSKTPVEAWFESVPRDQQETLLQLRAAVKKVAPDAVEELKWGRPCYSNEGGLFCYLHSTKSHATLGFQRGSSLRDPTNLLEGTGKDMRHVKLKLGASASSSAIQALLTQAASQQP